MRDCPEDLQETVQEDRYAGTEKTGSKKESTDEEKALSTTEEIFSRSTKTPPSYYVLSRCNDLIHSIGGVKKKNKLQGGKKT